MFGLFSKTPEDKMKQEILKKMESRALLSFGQNPMKDTPFKGTALISSITTAKEFYMVHSSSIAQEYGVNIITALSIIKSCEKSLINKYIE